MRSALKICVMVAAGAVASTAGGARADDDDVVVVPVAADGSVAEGAKLAEEVRGALVRRGVGVLSRPEAQLDQVAPLLRDVDGQEAASLARALFAARDAKKPDEVAEHALRMAPLLESLRSTDYARTYRGTCGKRCEWSLSVQESVVGACIDGVEALRVLGRVGEGYKLVELCADHPWLMDVLPRELRPVYEPLLHATDLQVSTAPSGLPVAVAGSAAAARESWPVRVRDGGRVPVVVSCPQPQERRRAHWVEAQPGARELSVTVDCDLDAAVHVDEHGLWLASSAYTAAEHVRALGRLVGAGRVLTVDRVNGRFRMQLRGLRTEDSGSSVTLPIGYSSRQLERAVDGLFAARAAGAEPQLPKKPAEGASGSSAPLAREPSRPWVLWTGVGATVVGVGVGGAAWSLGSRRKSYAETLSTELVQNESLRSRWDSLRVPMLAAAASAASAGAAGASLLVVARPEWFSWWLAAGAGAAGAGLGVWGIVDVAQGARCATADPRGCAAGASQRDRGVLLLATAVPLLAIPFTKAARLTRGGGMLDKASLGLGVAGLGVRLNGCW